MAGFVPVAFYGLEVPPGEVMVKAAQDFPTTIRITMAAIDPTAEPSTDGNGNVPNLPRSTLKIFKARDLEDNDEDEDDLLQSMLAEASDDEDDVQSDDEANGGPSDPTKSKKAQQAAALKKLLDSKEDDSEEEKEDTSEKLNGTKSKKGKGKAGDSDDEGSEDSDDDELENLDLEEYVVCTLDTERNYQQPLDITIGENEAVWFTVTGHHSVHLTGNILVDPNEEEEEDSEDEYDFPPGVDEIMAEDDELSDELDDVDSTPRIKEIDTDDDEEAPKLVDTKKSKKRAADDDSEGLDGLVAKDQAALSKKQQKKLKNNKGEAVAAETAKDSPKTDKKVQFAKNLEQGPTGPAKDANKKEDKKEHKKTTLGVKVVQGITIDDRKLGSGPGVKKGDKVGLRYIGKLEDGKVFDSNKKGKPFSFEVGAGQVVSGLDIGLIGMSVGGERRLTLPASKAYGSKSVPGIPPNSNLIFDLKLVKIN